MDTIDTTAFDDVPRASARRRLAALGLDVAAVLGAPWLILMACVPLIVLFIELVPVAIAVVLVSAASAAVLRRACRLENGDLLSPGQLAAGLTVLRTQRAHRFVLAADAQEHRRPPRGRLVAGRTALALTSLVALATISGSTYLACRVAFAEQIRESADAEWRTQEPEARRACDALLAELLADDPDGGEGLVSGAAAERLPEYRARVRRDGVTGFDRQGDGGGDGEWEYMFAEVCPATAGSETKRSVSVVVRQEEGRFVVTAIGESESFSAAPDTGPGDGSDPTP